MYFYFLSSLFICIIIQMVLLMVTNGLTLFLFRLLLAFLRKNFEVIMLIEFIYVQLIISHWCKKWFFLNVYTALVVVIWKSALLLCLYIQVKMIDTIICSVIVSWFLTIETLELYKLLHYEKKILDIFIWAFLS